MHEINQKHIEFTDYYEELKDKLFTFLYYRLNFDKSLAEDLMMDITLKAYEKFESFDLEKGTFKQWIFTIANNHLKNHWRSLKKQIVSLDLLEEDGVQFVDEDETDFKNIENKISRKNILKILKILKPKETEVIILRYLNDLSFKEIAQITKQREGAIRTQLNRALKRFKEHYQKIYPASNE